MIWKIASSLLLLGWTVALTSQPFTKSTTTTTTTNAMLSSVAKRRSLSFVMGRNSRQSFLQAPSPISTSSSALPMMRTRIERIPNRHHSFDSHHPRWKVRWYASMDTLEEHFDDDDDTTETDAGFPPRLRSYLEEYRTEQSQKLGKSPSGVLSETVLDGICAMVPPPATPQDLMRVKGLGAKTLERCGVDILDLVSKAFREEAMGADFLEAGFPEDDASAEAEVDTVATVGSSSGIESSSSSSSMEDSLSISEYSSQENALILDNGNLSDNDDTKEANEENFQAPSPSLAPEEELVEEIPSTPSFSLDSYVAPAPYSAPEGFTGVEALDSYVAPAPYSFDDVDEEEEEDDYEEEEISEESFGANSLTTPAESEEKSKQGTPKKLRKTQLKADLKDYRKSQTPYGKEAYTVLTNAAIDGIYAMLPLTKTELMEVKGIGPKKLEMYGDDILAIVAPYAGLDKRKGQTSDEDSSEDMLTRPNIIDPESLTDEQRRAADMIFGLDRDDGQPQNVFVTGSAGTGKSHLLKYVVEVLQGRQNAPSNMAWDYRNLHVGVCAPTGVAAVIVGGSTLHSFFGIGLGTGSKSSLLKKVHKNQPARTRIDQTDVLIIDECSMLSSELLETLDMVAREIRKDGIYADVPFGGMQVIAFGDFFQLPPVYRYDGSHERSWRPFCFDSPVWSELGLSENMVELREVQRQEHEDFVNLLNKVRIGTVKPRDIDDLNQKCLVGPHHPLPQDGILPTRLYVLNRDVDLENTSRLEELKGEEIVCKARDVWRQSMPVGTPAAVKKKMKESLDMELPETVRLKVGAQVMLTRNKDLDRNLVNGSRGVVEGFVQPSRAGGTPIPVVRFDSGLTTRIDPVESSRFNADGGKGCLVRMQVPLKLAWAITIHKSQGSTLSRASLDISSAFEFGQCYVALSRVKSLEGLWLERPAELRHVLVSPQVMDLFSGDA